jgi:hypothetical protein
MCLTYVGNQTEIRLCNPGKRVNFALMIGAHFDDGYFGIGRYGQQSERHADMVVQIALSEMHPEAHGQCAGYQFLGGGFSVAAGNADEWNAESAPVMTSQLLQGGKDIRYQNVLWQSGKIRVVYNDISGAPLKRVCGKSVAVKMIAFERKKKASAFDAARIGHHHWVLLENGV